MLNIKEQTLKLLGRRTKDKKFMEKEFPNQSKEMASLKFWASFGGDRRGS